MTVSVTTGNRRPARQSASYCARSTVGSIVAGPRRVLRAYIENPQLLPPCLTPLLLRATTRVQDSRQVGIRASNALTFEVFQGGLFVRRHPPTGIERLPVVRRRTHVPQHGLLRVPDGQICVLH